MGIRVTSSGKVKYVGPAAPPIQVDSSAATLAIKTSTVEINLASGVTATSFFPDGACLLGVVGRITTAVTTTGGPTAINVTDGAATFGVISVTANAIAVGTTVDMKTATTASPKQYVANTDLTITFTGGGGPTFTAGRIKVVLYYIDIAAPTA